MSSSPTSSSSTSGGGPETSPFSGFLDVVSPVDVILGFGSITVRRCLSLQKHSVIRLDQSAGEDLLVVVNGVPVARGEVVIVEDSTAIRITEIPAASGEA